MINKKILAGFMLVSIIIAGIGATFADNTSTGSTGTGSTNNGYFNNYRGFGLFKHKLRLINLSQEEKTALSSMSNEERKAFFDKKKEEQKLKMEKNIADRELKEGVIDALLAGNTLTAEQEVLRAEIINERSDRKIKRDEIKKIIDKKESGLELTDEEILKLKEFRGGKKGRHGFRDY